MGLVDRRPVVCRNLAMGFWVPLQYQVSVRIDLSSVGIPLRLDTTPQRHLITDQRMRTNFFNVCVGKENM